MQTISLWLSSGLLVSALDGFVYADYLFYCVNVVGPLLGLHLLKAKGDGRGLGVAICKAAS